MGKKMMKKYFSKKKNKSYTHNTNIMVAHWGFDNKTMSSYCTGIVNMTILEPFI